MNNEKEFHFMLVHRPFYAAYFIIQPVATAVDYFHCLILTLKH